MPDAFVDDLDCPYVTTPDRPFVWFRARQLGGRYVIPGHGRQYYRLGESDFAPPDGLSLPWPLRSGELDAWYALVESRVGLSGMREGLAWLPDGELTCLLELSVTELDLTRAIRARWSDFQPVLGRFAPPFPALDRAAQTKRLLIRQGAIAREIEVDGLGRVRGVVWFDEQTRTEQRACAPLVFLCASALESTRLLLLSRSSRNPDGLGAKSGVLGRYLMDHIKIGGQGRGPQILAAPSQPGRCLYLPRFDNRNMATPNPGRGFGVQIYQSAGAGDWSYFSAGSYAEMLPRPENRVLLDADRRDAWGIPVLRIECEHSHSELARTREQISALRELADAVGVTLTHVDDVPPPPGCANHECGTARMGADPDNSVVDPHNECWDARGLYLTDGACFPSQGTQNPMLTILALTARACDHAIRTSRGK